MVAKDNQVSVRPGLRHYLGSTGGVMLMAGMALELLMSISALVISATMDAKLEVFGTVVTREHQQTLFLINSCVALGGALLIIAGALRVARSLRISPKARNWVYVATVFYLLYRLFDILQSYSWLFLQKLFGVSLALDLYLSNLLLVISCLSLLIGLVRALIHADSSNKILEKQNIIMDYQVQQCRRLEGQARDNEAQLTVLLDSISSPIFFTTHEGIILGYNKTFAQLFSDKGPDLKKKHLREVLPPSLFESGRLCSQDVIATSAPASFKGQHNGRIYETTMYPVFGPDGSINYQGALAQDITDKVRSEKELRLLEAAIANAAESIMITNVSGEIEYVNPAFEEITGFSAEEAKKRNPSFLGKEAHGEEFHADLWEMLAEGKVWRGTFFNKRKDGTAFEEKATISPIMDENGQITHYVGVKRDVTRERELERQLLQIQKMEDLGVLAGGIAHNLNNALTIILGRSELALESLPFEDSARESLDIIMRTANNSSKLIKQILSFAKQHSDEAEVAPLAPLLQENIQVMRAYLPSNVTIHEKIQAPDPFVLVEANELQQIVVNLLNNANHALQPDGGIIEIDLDRIELDTALSTYTRTLKPGSYVRLRVSDTGKGIDPSRVSRIFEPFYSTKEMGQGSGLGLATVHSSVKRVGGGVTVSSTVGEGACFEIYWPEVKNVKQKRQIVEKIKPEGQGASVLIVDDLEDVVDMLVLGLQNYGFEVKAFSDCHDALTYMEQYPETVDIAVLDYMMPKMNGLELAKRLHVLRPNLPTVLLSGYSNDLTEEEALNQGFFAVLSKPISTEKLAHILMRDSGLYEEIPAQEIHNEE